MNKHYTYDYIKNIIIVIEMILHVSVSSQCVVNYTS